MDSFREECKRRLVTASEIQALLKLPYRIYVRRLVGRGKLPEPVYRSDYPRLNLYDREEVEEFISNDGNSTPVKEEA